MSITLRSHDVGAGLCWVCAGLALVQFVWVGAGDVGEGWGGLALVQLVWVGVEVKKMPGHSGHCRKKNGVGWCRVNSISVSPNLVGLRRVFFLTYIK